MLVLELGKMLCILVLCPALLGAVQTLTIDSQLGTSVEDCFERITIGEQLPPDAIYRNVSELTTRECETICKQDKQCQSYDYGVGAKGNATCNLSTVSEKELKEKSILRRHPDYDVYIRRFQCEQSPPSPLQQPQFDEGEGPAHRPVFRPDEDEPKRPLDDYPSDLRPFETVRPDLLRPIPPYRPAHNNYIDERPDDYNQKPALDNPPSYGAHTPPEIPYRPNRPSDSAPYRPNRPEPPSYGLKPQDPYRPHQNQSYTPDPYDVLHFQEPYRPVNPDYWRPDPYHPPLSDDIPDLYGPKPVRPSRPNDLPDPYGLEKPQYHYIVRPNKKPRPEDTGYAKPGYPAKPDPYVDVGHPGGPVGPHRPYDYRPYDKPTYSYDSQYASNYGQSQYQDNSIYLEIYDPPRPYKPPKRPIDNRPSYGPAQDYRPGQNYGSNYGYDQGSHLGYGSQFSQSSYSQSQSSHSSYGQGTITEIGFDHNRPQDPGYRPQKPGYRPQDSTYRPQKPDYGSQNPGYGGSSDSSSDSTYRPQKPNYGSQNSGYGSSSDTPSDSAYRPQKPVYGSQNSGYGGNSDSSSDSTYRPQKPDYGTQNSGYGGSSDTSSGYGSQKPSDVTQRPSYGGSQGSYGISQSSYGSSSHSDTAYGSQSYGGNRPSYGSNQNDNHGGYGIQKPQKPSDTTQRPSYGGNQGSYGDNQPSYDGQPSNDGSSSYGGSQSFYGGYVEHHDSHYSSQSGQSYGGYGRPPYDKPYSDNRPGYGNRPTYSDNQGYGNRPYEDRPGYGDSRPDRPYGDRPYERPPYDRPPYGDRPSHDNRPSYGDKPNPSYDNRPSYGDSKPSLDRPTYNRPSYNDKPTFDRPSHPSYGGNRPSFDNNRPDPPSYGGQPGSSDSSSGYGGEDYKNSGLKPTQKPAYGSNSDSRPNQTDSDRPGIKPVYEYELDKPNNVPSYIVRPGGEVVTSRPVAIGDFGEKPGQGRAPGYPVSYKFSPN